MYLYAMLAKNGLPLMVYDSSLEPLSLIGNLVSGL